MKTNKLKAIINETVDTLKSMIVRGLRRTLLIWFLLLSLVPLTIVSLISYQNAYSSLYKNSEESLRKSSEVQASFLKYYFREIFTDLSHQADETSCVELLNDLKNAYTESGKSSAEFTQSYQWVRIAEEKGKDLQISAKVHGYSDILLIDDLGNILFSVQRGPDLGSNLFNGKYATSLLARATRATLNTGRPAFSDFEFYEPANNEAIGFTTAVIVDEFGDKIGLMAFRIRSDQINQILQTVTGFNETGEAYLVGEDYLMRTESRFNADSMLRTNADSEAVRSGLAGQTGTMITRDYRKVKVLSAYSSLNIQNNLAYDVQWAFVSEIDAVEAFAAADSQRFVSIGLLFFTGLVVTLLAVFSARRIVQPISRLSEFADRAADGEIIQNISGLDRKDEIGVLANSFSRMNESSINLAQVAERISAGDLTVSVKARSEKDVLGIALSTMVENLLGQISGVNEGVTILNTATNNIMISVSQLSSSAAEQVTSLGEAVTTVDEVKQTADVSNQKAKAVAENGQSAVDVSEKGTDSVLETIEGMKRIKEQMNQIAQTIINLREQSQTIGEIIISVNDLSEQSNLLAVNAAIEAAKAGEHGKGFAVVAQEIKSLAQQSKKATGQIRSILTDIQKSIGSAVEAAETGGKTVSEGMKLSEKSGDAIQQLASGIEESAQAATQIAASSQQQLIGMDQVTLVMENLREASRQISSSTDETEQAISELQQFSDKLADMMKQYTVARANP